MNAVRRLPLLSLLLALALVACSPALPLVTSDNSSKNGDVITDASDGSGGGDFFGGESGSPEVALPPGDAPAPGGGTVVDQTTATRLVIKNATLSIVVKDPADASTRISALAESMGGFVVSSY